MRELVEALCSDECGGRAPGTPGGRRARQLVVEAFREAGLDPFEQEVSWCKGANVLATVNPEAERFVIVGAHFDHLGTIGGKIYRGADDNAAAVAILVEAARGLVKDAPEKRGVIVAAFDAEESPYFGTPAMGSQLFATRPTVPLDRVDMMVCMDLVGHAFGPEGVPGEVRESLFALGGERSRGTEALVSSMSRAEPGLVVRPVDVEIVPPLSDYLSFWRRGVPFLFLSSGRSRVYHTVDDTPEHLDFARMAATARWLEGYVRASCERPEERVDFLKGARADRTTLRALVEITGSLSAVSEEAAQARAMCESLLGECDSEGRLPGPQRDGIAALVQMLEHRLS